MNAYTICLVALLVGGVAPALWITARGEAADRLVGLLIGSAVVVFALLLFSQVGPGQSYDLVLPLVLVPLAYAGTLVFTRLLSRSAREDR